VDRRKNKTFSDRGGMKWAKVAWRRMTKKRRRMDEKEAATLKNGRDIEWIKRSADNMVLSQRWCC